MSADSSTILAGYDRWLHAVANRIGNSESDHDDLVQEGRVAMWRALATYDEARGSLPSWLTRAAESRMKNVAWGKGQPFGREATRGVREVEVGPSLDALEEGQVDALLGSREDDQRDDEVLRAVGQLAPRQREYVLLRFWAGLDPTSRAPGIRALVAEFPVLAERWHWQRARPALADRLRHLAA